MKVTVPMVIGGVLVLGAAGLVHAAISAGGGASISLPKFTEERIGALQEHVVGPGGLDVTPVDVPHRYPGRVAPWLGTVITHGFTPLWQAPDPQVASLPAEEMW